LQTQQSKDKSDKNKEFDPKELESAFNYYKDYKDGINESTLDRFRSIINRRQQEKEKQAQH